MTQPEQGGKNQFQAEVEEQDEFGCPGDEVTDRSDTVVAASKANDIWDEWSMLYVKHISQQATYPACLEAQWMLPSCCIYACIENYADWIKV